MSLNAAKSYNVGDSESWKAGEDFVFAYQLLKIEFKGRKGTRVEIRRAPPLGSVSGKRRR